MPDQHDRKLRRPSRTALLIAAVVIPALFLGYGLVWIFANGHGDERCLDPGVVENMSSVPGTSYTLVDHRAHPLLRNITCYYETPDGQRFQREVDLFENVELF